MEVFELKDLAGFLKEPLIENVKITSVAVDSRLIEKGALFFALKGEHVDGHNFLKEAALKGAVAAVVSRDYVGEDFGMQLFKTEDPLDALQMFAREFIKKRAPLVIGITGSVGKTTTKEFVACLLEKNFNISKNKNSYNGQIGLPLSILNANPYSDILILEYGMNFKSEMSKLLAIAEPHIVVVTPIAEVHLGNFSSVEEIACEKSIILESKHLRLAIIHEASSLFKPIQLTKGIKKVTYGTKHADYKISENEKKAIILSEEEGKVFCDLSQLSSHHLENFLPAYIIAKNMRMTLSDIQEGATKLKPFTHRFEKLSIKNAIFIDDSYNANPYAMKASLQNLPKPKPGCKTLAVIGEMGELGQFSENLHKEIGVFALDYLDKLICYGEKSKPLYEAFNKVKEAKYCSSKKDIVDTLKLMAQPGDVVLIKGSNSNKLWEVVDLLRK